MAQAQPIGIELWCNSFNVRKKVDDKKSKYLSSNNLSFIDYFVLYTASTGNDSLYTFATNDSLVDTVLFKNYTDSSFHLYFTKEYSGSFPIVGYSLNNTVVTSLDTVVIITPFSINSVDSAVFGEQLHCYLSISYPFDSLFTKDATDSVTWIYNMRDSIIKHISDTFNLLITTPDQFAIKAIFSDAHNNRSKEISHNFNVTTIPPTIDAPSTFTYRVATVRLTVTFGDANDSVDTVFCILNNDTTKKKVVYQ